MRLPQPRTNQGFLAVVLTIFSLLGPRLLCGTDSASPKASPLVATPASLAFPSVPTGSTASLLVTVSNPGTVKTLTVNTALVTGTGFAVSGLNLPLALQPGASYTFTVSFSPLTTGTFTGSITLTSRLGKTGLIIPLSGTAIAGGQLSVSPASLNFGSVTVGSSESLPATLTALNGSVTLTSGNSSNGLFQLSGLTFPVTLASGQSVSCSVTFTPQSTGSTSGTITFANNGTTLGTMAVTGSGTAPQHSVSLSWNASTSVVIGYNVYRSLVSGGPYSKISSAVDPNTVYTDSSVSGGLTYYYVTDSVDSTGAESVYSNEVVANIPFP